MTAARLCVIWPVPCTCQEIPLATPRPLCPLSPVFRTFLPNLPGLFPYQYRTSVYNASPFQSILQEFLPLSQPSAIHSVSSVFQSAYHPPTSYIFAYVFIIPPLNHKLHENKDSVDFVHGLPSTRCILGTRNVCWISSWHIVQTQQTVAIIGSVTVIVRHAPAPPGLESLQL